MGKTAGDRLTDAKALLRSEAERIEFDPQTNSVFAFARSTFAALETGEQDLLGAEALVDEIHLRLADARASFLRDQHADCEPEALWGEVRRRLSEIADAGWDAFKAELEASTGGVVFTAHPTFALSDASRKALAKHAEMDGDESREALRSVLKGDSRDWSKSITLQGEHDEVQGVIANAQSAMAAYAGLVFDVAKSAFPDQWTTLRPAVPTVASWVGYDLDGRTDINWWQSVALRLSEKAVQLERYADAAAKIDCEGAERLAGRLRAAAALSQDEADLFAEDLTEADALVRAVKRLTTPDDARIVNASDIIEPLEHLLAKSKGETSRQILVLIAQIEALQLGTARVHLRVNAAQVRAVISRDLGLETEDKDLGRLAFQQLSERSAGNEPSEATFADLFLERSTARRQILMSALWVKHIDGGSPIRFLIAEAENPATVMGTLYLARQFGIDGMLDISPLFETPEALETGGRFIERLLQEPEFLRYLRSRGYLSIQLGFSDAGRFIGQVAADMAIERIHNLIARSLGEADPSLGLLIFNTHGESMGRGAWPGSFEQRFDHVLTDWTRRQARDNGIRLRHEVSFQGGDGFLHFATPILAETAYGAWCKHVLSDPSDCLDDPFYVETDFTWDTYRALRAWQVGLFDDENYARLLSDFATNLLVRAGSRQRRRSGGPKGPRALRAISHNATLHQMGVPVNTAGGLGSSVRREVDRLVSLLNRSPRMRSLLDLSLKARIMTTVPALRAYGKVYDPGYWVAVARHASPDEAAVYRRVYYSLKDSDTHESISRVADKLSIDIGKFDRLLSAMDNAPSVEERHESRLDLHVLHGVRQAVMMHAIALAGRMPSLSGRHDVSLEDFMGLILEMRIGEAVSLLRMAFPASSTDTSAIRELGGSPDQSVVQGYDQLHADIIEPLDRIDGLMHKITLAIGQAYRAYG